jgi:hypothetical protein
MSDDKLIACWPLLEETSNTRAFEIVSKWKADRSVRAYLDKKFPHLVEIPNGDPAHDAQEYAWNNFGPKHLDFFAYDIGEPMDRLSFDDFKDRIHHCGIVIIESANWCWYPKNKKADIWNFYLENRNDATALKLAIPGAVWVK